MQFDPVYDMHMQRQKNTRKMQRARKLMLLPTYGLFVPIIRLLDWFGLAGRTLRFFHKKLSEKLQIEKSFSGYEPNEHDVIVSAYVKSGTNWMMQIAHQIANRGQGEFEHIHDVIPWPDGMPDYALALEHDAVYKAAPTGLRVIKSHLSLEYIPYSPSARYICVARDPKDMMVSGYYFFRDTALGPLMPSAEAYLELLFSKEFLFNSWAQHIHSFWQARHRDNVLFLTFREMKQDAVQNVSRIASFMDVDLTDAELAAVVEQSTFAAMRAIDHKFFPGLITPWSNINGKMMRKGKVGDAGSLFTAVQLTQIDTHFKQVLQELGSDFPYDQFFT
ncbi:hypothetical protein MNBD_CHLOROFLEXI01-4314 [hydrothermal vent metagenome]|uniref:Sulfotransferase domain-containing protein n=1 Tax=hydrothermal vent metagenome TaxID=652676 RepID=A0A3B0V3E0_9ZZZZ